MARLIGTAGHVDHGKTTLIRALTGIDADRLPEEKQRGMTIDLGFAFVELEGIGRVSIVDVPGHERFVTNMLAGALGVDVALLCVAADESVMPQTREHLQIVELLPVERLVVALTRCDAADTDLIEIARMDVGELLAGTRFESAPIIAVSAHTGEGLAELKTALKDALKEDSEGIAAPWYLPIDRVFSVKGHGTVVTGTLMQGAVSTGDAAVIQPDGLEVRIRGIESHDTELDRATKGQRTALNLGGIKLEQARRGQIVAAPGTAYHSDCIDASVRWVTVPKHGLRVRVSIGTDEGIGRVFLDRDDPAKCQLRFDNAVAAVANQPIIVRRYSPPDVLGGGRVTVPLGVRKQQSKVNVDQALSLEAQILEVLSAHPEGASTEEICRLLGRSANELGTPFERLKGENKVLGFAGQWITAEAMDDVSHRIVAALQKLHESRPTQAAWPRDVVQASAGLKWTGKPLDRLMAHLAQLGLLRVSGSEISLASFQVQLSPRQQELLDRVMTFMAAAGINALSPDELAQAAKVPVQAVTEILRLGIEAGAIVRVPPDLFYTRKDIEIFAQKVRAIGTGKPFSAAEFRDMMGTTRKFAIPLLEYFDSIRLTTRMGELRSVNQPR